MSQNEKIVCELCKAEIHSVANHLKSHHPDVTVDNYKAQFPQAPMLSEYAKALVQAELVKRQQAQANPVIIQSDEQAPPVLQAAYSGMAMFEKSKKALHEVFDMDSDPAAKSAGAGNPIPITVITKTGCAEMVPAIDPGYVFDADELKDVMLAFEMQFPLYVFGHKGAGKTELLEQCAARTGRPAVRVQHTVNTEESQIQGQWSVKAGNTEFLLGPLPMAMMNGWLYIADEYDFALPSVTAVYQAVLEGKPLYIKDAPPELRLIKPHPNFRFAATGNTNGSGDESGLYQGTNVQNSANYDRFSMTIHKNYLPEAKEIEILVKRTGLKQAEAKKMVQFGKLIRDAYHDAKISDTVSPRTLISATKIGIAKGSFRRGITSSFTNKLPTICRKVAEDIAQRIFN